MSRPKLTDNQVRLLRVMSVGPTRLHPVGPGLIGIVDSKTCLPPVTHEDYAGLSDASFIWCDRDCWWWATPAGLEALAEHERRAKEKKPC